MKISQDAWKSYIDQLSKINNKAAEKVAEFYRAHPNVEMEELISYAYSVANYYGEAAGELACEMYDAVASTAPRVIPSAESAATATYGEIAQAIQGAMMRTNDPDAIGSVVGRKVKTVGLDSLINNSLRDGAEFAWIPSGDTCPFCMMLASNGWQRASKKALKHGHASHVHNNCNCTYAIRFDHDTEVEGYNPDYYKRMYDEAEGDNWKDKNNFMRRDIYAKDPEKFRAQKKAWYHRQSGGHHYIVSEDADERYKQAINAYERYSKENDAKIIAGNTGFSVEQINQIRSHVFFNKHDLYESYDRFAPEYNMAVAWKRLKEGTFLQRDITLLNHELLENEIETLYNISASEAHARATQTYDWWGQLMKETKGRGEKDGLL